MQQSRSSTGCGQRTQRGAAAVEFALILPVLVMLLFGVVEFGILLAQKSALSSAVREGARYGSVTLYASETVGERTCQDVVDATRNQATTLEMTSASVEVDVLRDDGDDTTTVCSTGGAGDFGEPPCDATFDREDLVVVARFQGSVSIPATPISRSIELESTGVYRCEY